MNKLSIKENIQIVRNKIQIAAEKTNRNAGDIRLIAVTKTVNQNQILEALDAGITDIGENRVQDLCQKYDTIDANAHWHLIGTLQRNKLKYIANKDILIHSIDRTSILKELEKTACVNGRLFSALVQVNISKEETKSGIFEEDLLSFISEMIHYPHIQIKGLMTIAPLTDEPEKVRHYFRRLKQLFDEIKMNKRDNVEMKYLSMGMTNDFEIAIEEGSNMVRIGRAIFGEREKGRR